MKNTTYQEFREVAIEYCQLIEDRDKYKLRPFLRQGLALLSKLCAIATFLPEVDSEEHLVEKTGGYEDWKTIFDDLRKKFGKKLDGFYAVYDAYNDKEVLCGSLADGLADFYGDLKLGLAAEQSGASHNNIIWRWRFDYWNHWGKHATETIFALHCYLSDKMR